MGLFRSKEEAELDSILARIEMNMSNNYKDAAQQGLKDYEQALQRVKAEGKMKPAKLSRYESLLTTYQTRLKGYTHKDQKPYWT